MINLELCLVKKCDHVQMINQRIKLKHAGEKGGKSKKAVIEKISFKASRMPQHVVIPQNDLLTY